MPRSRPKAARCRNKGAVSNSMRHAGLPRGMTKWCCYRCRLKKVGPGQRESCKTWTDDVVWHKDRRCSNLATNWYLTGLCWVAIQKRLCVLFPDLISQESQKRFSSSMKHTSTQTSDERVTTKIYNFFLLHHKFMSLLILPGTRISVINFETGPKTVKIASQLNREFSPTFS